MRKFFYASVILLCLTAASADAQQTGSVPHFLPATGMIGDGATTATPARPPLKIDVSQFTLDGPSPSARTSPRTAVQDPGSSKRSATRRVFGAIVGGTAGFFAGGYTGAWIEGDRCQCDDPGLKGALIGAPIGAAVGAILGALYLF